MGLIPIKIISRKTLAREKNRYIRGTTWTGSLFNILIITLNLKVFEGFIAPLLPSFINMQTLYLASIPGYILFNWVIGYADEKKGIWKQDNDYNYDVTPKAKEIYDKIDYIYTKLGGIKYER